MRKPRKGLYLILAFSLFLNLLLPPLAIANEEPGTSSNACVETIVEEVDGEEAVPSTPEEADSFTTEDAEPSTTEESELTTTADAESTTITEENSAAVDGEEAASVDEDESSIADEGNVEETTPSDEEDNSSPTEDVTEETPQPCDEESDEQLDNSLNNRVLVDGNKIEEERNIITNVKIWSNPDENGQKTEESVEIDDSIRVDIGAPISVHYLWDLASPHTYSAGDTFTFQLPNEFAPGLTLNGQLFGSNSEYVADFVVNGNEVTFTFTDAINDGEGFTGDFYVWRKFVEKELEDSTKHNIVFETSGGPVQIPVHFKNTTGADITKEGKPYQKGKQNSRNPDEIEWIVDFNLGEEKVTNAVFTDILPQGLTIDLTSIEVYELKVKLDGSVDVNSENLAHKYSSNLLSPSNPSDPPPNGFEIDFEQIDKAYRVIYKTSVTAPTGEPNGDKYTPNFINNATVAGTNLEAPFRQSKTAGVRVYFNEPLNKRAVRYDSTKQEIQWTIEYNYNQQSITQNNAKLKDDYKTTEQMLIDGEFKVYQVEIDSNGKAVQDNKTLLTEGNSPNQYTLIKTSTGFELQFNNEIKSAYEIVYKTKAVNRVHEGIEVENTVEMHDGTKKSDKQQIGQVVFQKKFNKIDYKSKKITWIIELNKDEKDMTGIVIKDNCNR